MKLLITHICLLALLFSCIESNKEEATPEAGLNQNIQSSFSEQKITCEDKSNCPGFIGRILIKQGIEVKTCTAFLVEPDTLMTSPSCLGSHITERTVCSDIIKVYFPETNEYQESSFNCQEIVRDTIYSPKKNDVFLIKIADTKREIAVKSFRGVADSQEVNLWSVEQTSSTTGIVKNQKCLTSYHSIIAPEYDSRKSARISLSNCDLKFGSQGSPVLNSSDNAIAVVDESYREDYFKDIADKFIDFGQNQKPKSLSMALNFSCMRFLENIWNIDTYECAYNETISAAARSNVVQLLDKYWADNSKLKEFVKLWQSRQKPGIYQWEPTALPIKASDKMFSELLVTFRPKCMNRPLDWIEYFRRPLGGLPKLKEVFYSLPIIQMKLSLNNKGQLQSELYTLDHSLELMAPLYLRVIRNSQVAVFTRKTVKLRESEYESSESDDLQKSEASERHLELLSSYSIDEERDYFCQ